MQKNTLLYILLIFLIVVNGFFLYNYMGSTSSEKGKRPPRPMDFIVKELQFDGSQLKEFRELNADHHQKMRHISHGIKRLKDALFNRLSDAVIDREVIDSITTLIGEKEIEKEKMTFYHFKSIQEICNEDQKEEFKKIINDALHKAGREQRGQRPPHPERPKGHRPPQPKH
ncbi:hypothetical protein A8C32_17510 [Flavivirga aquatica]|uniref:Periplasmic heavy metal sensor n=1 Tax=Flavivirga aquatica TaxID=1849968 RepID=A0A1E5T892_9FLAO|nr:hypothetical protein [Flavivirga aquatica]OEK07594.1 hypothetical protein A8C32_17510 [Flavivirga aquatica]